MPALVTSVSPRRVGLGIAIVLLGVLLYAAGYYHPTALDALALGVLCVALAARGLSPFGETNAYHVLQALAFGFWGVVTFVTDRPTFVSAGFVLIGVVGTVVYGVKAFRDGVWSPVEASADH